MEPSDDHGRPLTANPEAAAWYRRAQRSVDREVVEEALIRALQADPNFALAAADLALLLDTGPARSPLRVIGHGWERHHIEIVRAARADDHPRAGALLAEHLASVVCDPIAIRLVPFGHSGLAMPACHPTARLGSGKGDQGANRAAFRRPAGALPGHADRTGRTLGPEPP